VLGPAGGGGVGLGDFAGDGGEADLESLGFAGPAFAFGFGDAGVEVVADLPVTCSGTRSPAGGSRQQHWPGATACASRPGCPRSPLPAATPRSGVTAGCGTSPSRTITTSTFAQPAPRYLFTTARSTMAISGRAITALRGRRSGLSFRPVISLTDTEVIRRLTLADSPLRRVRHLRCDHFRQARYPGRSQPTKCSILSRLRLAWFALGPGCPEGDFS
jgi:hypothetical protein